MIFFTDVLTKRQKPYLEEDVPKFKEIIAFECRGLAIEEFRFGVSNWDKV